VSFVQRSDFDVDGDLDADDYVRLRAYHLTLLVGDSPLETFAFGDADGDLDNDYSDFRLFKDDYIAAHGAAALNAVIASFGAIPEPCSGGQMLLAMSGIAWAHDCASGTYCVAVNRPK
jgi:hypothetical protein